MKMEYNNYNYTGSREVIGKCPRCRSDIYEGRKNFYCTNPNCSFVIWKESFFLRNMKKEIDSDMAKELLKNGKVYVDDLWSEKKQHYFSANLCMVDDGGRTSYSLSFPNGI